MFKGRLLRRIPFLSKVAGAFDTLESQNRELLERLLREREARLRDGLRSACDLGMDGLPLPPAVLRNWVAGTDDATWFLESGKRGAQAIVEILAKQQIELSQVEFVLDFGCGCGRVMRHLSSFESIKLHGTDYNRAAVSWCDENLNFGEFGTNLMQPPTRYRKDSFDVIYAFSVFTHLTEPLQTLWMQELHRILKPNGHLIISVHGDYYFTELSELDQARYRKGELVVKRPDQVGQNDCGAFHPESYVRNVLAKDFHVVDFIPQGALGNPWQDAYLLRSRER